MAQWQGHISARRISRAEDKIGCTPKIKTDGYIERDGARQAFREQLTTLP